MEVFDAKFIMGVTKYDKMPESIFPETAFVGRSNVGKSSLINSFIKRKNLARISSEPGKTREINFFLVQNRWTLVDMPGFGYASVDKDTRKQWSALNYQYLEKREHLKLVCCLIDSRHDPQDIDLAVIEFLEHHSRKYVIILTKCDKIAKKAVEARHKQLLELTSLCQHCVDVLPYSSVTDLGRKELIGIIKREVAFD